MFNLTRLWSSSYVVFVLATLTVTKCSKKRKRKKNEKKNLTTKWKPELMKGVQPKLISKQMMDKPTASSAILHFITSKLKHSSLARLNWFWDEPRNTKHFFTLLYRQWMKYHGCWTHPTPTCIRVFLSSKIMPIFFCQVM